MPSYRKIDFKIYATKGTAEFLKKFSISVQIIKVNEGSPHIVDFIEKNKIHLIINTTSGANLLQIAYQLGEQH